MAAYFNEIDPYAAAWLRNLIAAGILPDGDVDTRSIEHVQPEDLKGYTQCHFFAGIGGWAVAARRAGWPDDRELWSGSAPCQPFSVAGKQLGQDDERHLWPHYFRLIRARRPAVVVGEQVAAAVGKNWLDGVLTDLEGIAYSGRATVVPACAVDAPHRRDRIWFLADRSGTLDYGDNARLEGFCRHGARTPGRSEPGRSATPASGGGDRNVEYADLVDPREERQQRSGQFGGAGGNPGSGAFNVADARGAERGSQSEGRHVNDRHDRGRQETTSRCAVRGATAWSNAAWIIGHDGKARRIPQSGIRLLAHGIPARIGRLRAYGNAIVPQVAAEALAAYLDAERCGDFDIDRLIG